MKISVITPTGARPIAFAMCELWMIQQRRIPDEWIVVDDGEKALDLCSWDFISSERIVLRPQPYWRLGKNTQARNLISGLQACTGDIVIFVEDDDYYPPTYIENVTSLMQHDEKTLLLGEIPALYYHIGVKGWRNMNNHEHASLSQTAIRRALIPDLRRVCEESFAWIDIRLWARTDPAFKRTYTSNQVIGIKGLPGRPGVSDLHRRDIGWNPDPGGTQLRSWLGADAEVYGGKTVGV